MVTSAEGACLPYLYLSGFRLTVVDSISSPFSVPITNTIEQYAGHLYDTSPALGAYSSDARNVRKPWVRK